MTLTKEQVERVRSLEDENGGITADVVVRDAKNRKSPLHGLFEWNREKAAAAYWLDQARAIIGAVRVVVTNETTVVRSPVYVRDPTIGNEQGYRSTTALRSDPEKAREALVMILRVAAGHVARALELAEPLGLSADVEGLIEEIVGLQRRAQQAA